MLMENPLFRKRLKSIILLFCLFIFSLFSFNALSIYQFSFNYSENKSDVAIVLGVGTSNGTLSPIFKERINHSVYLYKKGIVKKIIFTGGYGENQVISDSEVAKEYAIKHGISKSDILIEEKSKFTHENLFESKLIMDSLKMKTALLVSDPLHMKRSLLLAGNQNINCESSPTRTTMYKSFFPKFKSLLYETFFYSYDRITLNKFNNE